MRSGNVTASAPLPPAPRSGAAWTGASADLSVVAGEYAGVVPPSACQNEVAIRAPDLVRSFGCHVKVADDGRVGWTQQGAIRVRHPDGRIENLTGAGNATLENPVFTRDGLAYVRVLDVGERAEVVVRGADEAVVAQVARPLRLALHGASADGRLLLVTTFAR